MGQSRVPSVITRIVPTRVTGVHEPLPKVPGEDREVGFDLDELQECWQSLGVVAAAEGGGCVYHLLSAPRHVA